MKLPNEILNIASHVLGFSASKHVNIIIWHVNIII